MSAAYHAHLNVLLDPAGKVVEAAVHHTPGHQLPGPRYRTGVHRWACLVQTGGCYAGHEAGRRAILEILDQRPELEWVRPLLEAAP